MKLHNIFLILLCSLCLLSCSKDSGPDATSSTGTGKGGSLSRFTISGNYLYAVDNANLYAYDISDPQNPSQTGSSYIGSNVETIYTYGNNLFVGSSTGMFIYSLDDPSLPVKVGSATHARSCDPVVANGNYAYVTLKGSSWCGEATSGLYVHNIQDISQPQLVKLIELNSPEGLALEGSLLYVCCNNDGLKIFDVSNPQDPVEIRTVTGAYFKDAIVYGQLLICYVSTGISLYDIADPSNPQLLKTIAN